MAKKTSESATGQSAEFFSDSADLEKFSRASVQVSVTNGSSFTGSCTLQVSNNRSTWADVTSTTISLSGASDSQIYDITEISTSFARVKVTVSTGSADFRFDWLLK